MLNWKIEMAGGQASCEVSVRKESHDTFQESEYLDSIGHRSPLIQEIVENF